MHDFNSLIFVVGFCTPKSQRSKSASEQKKECRNLAPKPVSKPKTQRSNKQKKLMTSITPVLPTLGAQPPLSPEGHHFSEHLAPLEVTGGPKEHVVPAKQDSGGPRSEALGSCWGQGSPKMWVVLAEMKETVSQDPLSLGLSPTAHPCSAVKHVDSIRGNPPI